MAETTGRINLRFLAEPTDANFGGKVHGGSAMKWLDQAGYVCASSWSGRYCVTAFVGDINFHQPIAVGDLVEAKSRIIRTGRTSMHVSVELWACNPRQCANKKSLHCIMVFVAVDEAGVPVEIPSWTPETEDDQRMQDYANRVIEMRKVNRDELNRMLTPAG